MRQFLALAKKETAGILLSPPLLFAAAFFVLLDSAAFSLVIARPGPTALFDEPALFMLFTSIVMFPLASMHAFTEENAEGTLETLLTAPVSGLAVILAKYAGAMAFVAIYLLHGLAYAAILAWGGALDWASTASAFLALIAAGSLAVSLGVFVSAMTDSPAAAAAGTGGALLFLALVAEVDPKSGTLASLIHSTSFLPHAKRWTAGVLDTGGMVYFVSCTALFLYWAWIAVGARRAERRGPRAGEGRTAALAFALVAAAAVLLVAQAAALHIGGFWGADAPPDFAGTPRAYFLPAALAAGALLCALLLRRPAPSRARGGALVCVLASLAIVLNLNWLARAPFRALAEAGAPGFLAILQARSRDVTEDRRNTLPPATLRALDALQGRLRIAAFLPEGLDVHGVPVADSARRLIERIADHTPLVAAAFADAEREPGRARRLAEELGMPPDNPGELLVLDYQGRRAFIPAAALAVEASWERQPAAGDAKWVFDGENRLTREMLRLADPRLPNAYFTYGHQELTLEGGARPERSMSALARRMAGADWRLRQHAIAQTGPIPPDCDLLVVAAPRTAFLEEEAEEVGRYLDRGGRLLAFAPVAGPEFAAARDPLNALLAGIGGGVRDDVVEDAIRNDNGQPLSPLGRAGNADAVFTLARSIRDNPYAAENGWTVERMIMSSPESVATAVPVAGLPPGGGKSAGPFTLLYRAAKETPRGEARAAVFASGRMAADSDSGRGANADIVAGLLHWLGGRGEEEAAPPRRLVDRTLSFSEEESRAALWLALAGLPLLWLVAGIFVWRARRD